MKICALLTALLTVTPLVAGDCYSGTDECCLCGGCCSPKNPSTYVGQQLTCSQVDLEYTFNLKYAPMSSSSCASMISKYRTTCCSTTSPTDVYQQPTQSSNNLPQGSYSTCDLCWKTGDQPTKPYTVLAILGIPGNPTCQIAYEMGQNGLIPDNLCYPLQDYVQGPCGCPQPSTACSGSNCAPGTTTTTSTVASSTVAATVPATTTTTVAATTAATTTTTVAATEAATTAATVNTDATAAVAESATGAYGQKLAIVYTDRPKLYEPGARDYSAWGVGLRERKLRGE